MALKIWWDLLALLGWYNGSFGTARLTQWDQDKMDNISQTKFLNAFSSMKMFEFPLKFNWSLFLSIQSIVFQYRFKQWLGAVQATSHYLNQWWFVYWWIYASLGLNELSNGWPSTSKLHCWWPLSMASPDYHRYQYGLNHCPLGDVVMILNV